MKKISIFVHFNHIKEHLTLEEMVYRIKNGIYCQWIKPLRRMLREGNREGYDSAKRQLDGFTVSADFDGGRQMKYLVGYTQEIGLDIDKLSDEELQRVKKLITECDYTHVCFISPSGNGLKVFVSVSTGVEEHLKVFLSLQRFYMALTGVEIDSSGKDVTRLCFVSDDEDLYYNPGATIFVPVISEEKKGTTAKPFARVAAAAVKPASPVSSAAMPTTDFDIYRRCVAYVERFSSYTEGHRNDFLYSLALQMRKAGLTDLYAMLMLTAEYDLGEREVKSCIKSAYGANLVGVSASLNDREKTVAAILPATGDAAEIENPSGDPDATSQKPPMEPPEEKKNTGRQQYTLKKTEKILSGFFEMRYNEVIGMVEWRFAKTKGLFQRMEDYDENSIFRMLHNAGQIIPLNTLHALLHSDYVPAFNPFTAYFKKLAKWDGVTDYIGQLSKTVKTSDDAYWDYCLRKWFVAFAISLIVEEVINHTVIVFIGAQGVGKTSWMKRLLPKAFKNYVGTAALHTDNKDTSIQLAECALIILDEMESLNRKDLASFKELITQPFVRVRRPYGRNSENLIHYASFAASVNHDKILTDLTGSRRYLCVTVKEMDYQHTVDMDGCMAQAYAMYKSGFKFWFDQEEIKVLTLCNEDYMSKSVAEELIVTWLRPVTRAEWDTKNQFVNGHNMKAMNATLIANFLMGKVNFTIGDAIVAQIGKIMSNLKYEYVKKGSNHNYLLRIVDADVVERDSNSLDDAEAQKKEQENNNQIIRLEEDLFKSSGDDKLPF